MAGDIDAAFAFAISMSVIAAARIPDDIDALLAAFKNVPAFVASVFLNGPSRAVVLKVSQARAEESGE